MSEIQSFFSLFCAFLFSSCFLTLFPSPNILHGCSSLQPSFPSIHAFTNSLHQSQTLDWPRCLHKAHGLKPRPVLLAPQPARSACSLAFTCLWAVISASWMPQPAVCTNLPVTLTGLSHHACWGFQTARKPATSSSERKRQPGSGLLEATRGKEESQSRAQGWITL